MRILRIVLVAVFAAALPARAQQAPAPVQPQAVAEDTVTRGISPGTAFFRSVLIPGWGQFSAGAKTRGAIFVAIQASSYFMLAKTLSKISDARDVEAERIAFQGDSLRSAMAEDTLLNRILSEPEKFDSAVAATASVIGIRKLIDSRKEQRQDWIAYTIFFTLASGVDAFVAAHLADFPATIMTRPAADGGVQFQVGIPFPRRQ